MRRLGKTQELKRRFQFFSIAGYIAVLGLTREFSLVLGAFSIWNVGAAGAIWLTLFVCCGMATVVFSMAEMASIAPTSGGGDAALHFCSSLSLKHRGSQIGQYHWVSEFAPRPMQKQVLYAVGWLCALGRQVANPTVAYIGAQQVLTSISICNRAYFSQLFFNVATTGKLPLLEYFAFGLHVLGLVVLFAVLWIFGNTAPAEETFTVFADSNGWGSVGLATSNPMRSNYIISRAMITAAITNFILGFISTVTLMFDLGTINHDLSDPSGQPWVAIVYRGTDSKAATIMMIIVMIILYFFSAINQITTRSRQLFAFARDKGVPFHRPPASLQGQF